MNHQFGAPLVLNPIFFIPLSVPNCQRMAFKFFIETLGMNSFTANLPWTTPGPFGINETSKFCHSFCCFVNPVDVAIYYPFLRSYDEQIPEEERLGKANDELKEKLL